MARKLRLAQDHQSVQCDRPVGRRQDGRERGDNVVHVPHDAGEIHAAVERCLDDPEAIRRGETADNPYSRGGAADLIVERLEWVQLDDALLRKREELL